jgi:hypothetical protein
MKDNRKVYDNQEILVNGNVVRFDGKGDPDKKVLKVYKYYGDITLQNEALQDFAFSNGYETVQVKQNF